MRRLRWRYCALALLAAVAATLAACGGDGAPPQPQSAIGGNSARSALAPLQPITDHRFLVARLYIMYLGRPADPDGLEYFAAAAMRHGVVDFRAGMFGYYQSNAVFASLVDSIAGSAEARRYLDGDDATFVTAIYQHMFNREPDAGGMEYWAGLLAQESLPRALLPLAILVGAHPDDLAIVEQKTALALAYTAALSTPERRAAFDSRTGLTMAREMLRADSAAATPAARLAAVERALAPGPMPVPLERVRAIIAQRCVACHSTAPVMPGFATAPRGIRFDTVDQILADARRIHVNVVQTEFMPYRNATHMPYAERMVIATWFETQGAGN